MSHIVTRNGIVASELALPKGGKVTLCSIAEYADAIRGRYLGAAKKAKTEILNEFVAVAGMHRKSIVRLLNRRSRSSGSENRGRPTLYRDVATAELKVAWEALISAPFRLSLTMLYLLSLFSL